MTRIDLFLYAAATFPELADECGVELVDAAAGVRFQIDAAWSALGDDTSNVDAAQALVDYHCLRRFRTAAAVRTDNHSLNDIRRMRSQIFEQIDRLTRDAAQRAAAAGHPVMGALRTHLWTTDWIEAEATA